MGWRMGPGGGSCLTGARHLLAAPVRRGRGTRRCGRHPDRAPRGLELLRGAGIEAEDDEREMTQMTIPGLFRLMMRQAGV